MTVSRLRRALSNLNGDLEVYFRKVAPAAGDIQEVDKVVVTTRGLFGKRVPCVILDRDTEEEGQK